MIISGLHKLQLVPFQLLTYLIRNAIFFPRLFLSNGGYFGHAHLTSYLASSSTTARYFADANLLLTRLFLSNGGYFGHAHLTSYLASSSTTARYFADANLLLTRLFLSNGGYFGHATYVHSLAAKRQLVP